MLATRAPLLSRALAQFARNGKLLGVAAKNSKQSQLQAVRFSGDWTYRTARESNPLSKRIWAQACGGCKWILKLKTQLNAQFQPLISVLSILNGMNFPISSYVVVDPLAFVLGLGSYCRRISISRLNRLDRCRAWNSTRWFWWRIVWINWKHIKKVTRCSPITIEDNAANISWLLWNHATSMRKIKKENHCYFSCAVIDSEINSVLFSLYKWRWNAFQYFSLCRFLFLPTLP